MTNKTNGEVAVLAIDPGRTTGVCILTRHGRTPTGRVDISVVDAMELEWHQRFHLKVLLQYMQHTFPSYKVVCESFNLYPWAAKGQAKIRSDFPSSQVIGLLDAYADELGIKVHYQTPGLRKQVRVLTEHAKSLPGPHARDAYRHGRYYLVVGAIEHRITKARS